MAQLQGTGPISINNIRSIKAPTVGNDVSLRDRERSYMSTNPTFPGPAGTGVCMPEDLLTVTNAENNTGPAGSKAKDVDGVWSYTAAPGYTASTPWGPHSLKEFYSAYNGIPTIDVQKLATGIAGNFTLRVIIGGEFAKTSSNYFIKVNSASWTGWPGNSSGIYDSSRPSGTYSVQVKDLNNCGADNTVTETVTYPPAGT